MQFWTLRSCSESLESLSLVPFERAYRLQLELLEKRIRDEIPDTVLFVEHPPTVTRGRGLQRKEGEVSRPPMPLPQGGLPLDWAYHEIERGGDLTFHGPGQLVIYPILKLDGSGFAPNRDLGRFLRALEQVFLDEIAGFGLRALRVEGATGIWIEGRASQPPLAQPLKIASLGIALRKWVSFHGVALNAVNPLSDFNWISPCGFSPEVMTRLADWIAPRERWAASGAGGWRDELEQSLARRIAGEDAAVELCLV